MPTLTDEKLIKYLAVAVTVVACVTRLSTAVASIANGLALLLVLYLWRQNNYGLNLSNEAKGYVKAYLIFILLMVPSLFVSDKPLVSLKELLRFLVWGYGSIIFIAITAFIRRRDYLVNMLTALLLITTADSLLAVGQVMLHMSRDNRGWGLGGHPLYLAGILCMALPVALVIALDPAFEKRLKKAASCTVAAATAGLFFNNSRSAWVTSALVVPITVFRYIRQQKKYLVIFALVLVGIGVYMASNPMYTARVKSITNTTTDGSNVGRILVWNSAVQMIKDRPVAGVGLEQFPEKYKKYQSKQEKQNLTHCHNNFLHVAAETGFVGLAGFVYFCGYVLVTSLKNYRKYRNPCDKLIFIVFLSNVVIVGSIDHTLTTSSCMRFMTFLIAVSLQMKTTKKLDNL